MMPAATQALPTQPPEGAAEEVRAGDAAAPSLDPSRMTANNVELDPMPVEAPKPKPVENRRRSLSRNSRLSPLPRQRQHQNLLSMISPRRPAKPMLYSWAR